MRLWALLRKEVIQMRRDRVTFAMMIGLPIIQLMLFGFAINADPRHLPTLVEMGDDGPLTRAVIAGLDQSGYFDFRGAVRGVEAGDAALRRGEANFVVVIPPGFERDVVRGRQPEILLAADASSLYARNVLDFLKLVIDKDGNFTLPPDDDIVAACLMCTGGEIKRKN